MIYTLNNTCDLKPSVTNYSQYAELSDPEGNSDENHTYSTLEYALPLELGDLTLSQDGKQQQNTPERLPRTKTKFTRKKISVLIIIMLVLIVVTVAAVIGVVFPKESTVTALSISTNDQTAQGYQTTMESTDSSSVKPADNSESTESITNDFTTQRRISTHLPSTERSSTTPGITFSIADSDCTIVSFTAVEYAFTGPAPLFWYSSTMFPPYEFRLCYAKVVTTRDEKLVVSSRSEIGAYSDSTVSVGDVTGARTECTEQGVVCLEIRKPGSIYTDWSLNVEAEDSTRVRVLPEVDSLQYLSSVSVDLDDPWISDIQIDQKNLEVSFIVDNKINEGTTSKIRYAKIKCLRGVNVADQSDGNIVTDNWGIKYS